MLRWLRGAGARPAEVAQMRARIADALWANVLRGHPYLHLPAPDEAERLRDQTAWLLASKTFNGAGGLHLTDAMRLAIAAQAALPILNLPVAYYEGWSEIIVYPGGFRVSRQVEDDAGVVHECIEELDGEAWPGGPVILAWQADAPAFDAPLDTALDTVLDAPLDANKPARAPHPGNVVIHEFAHKLDEYAGGEANGVPRLPPEIALAHWQAVLAESLDRFTEALDEIEAQLPAHIDPESPAADPWYARLALAPYAASDEAEFFAVSSEAFFVQPAPLAHQLPAWYALLSRYYRQDPLARFSPNLSA